MPRGIPALSLAVLCWSILLAPAVRAADPVFDAISVKPADVCAPQNVIDSSHVALHATR